MGIRQSLAIGQAYAYPLFAHVMPGFHELQLSPEVTQVLKDYGIHTLLELSEANVTNLQRAFVAAARDGRYQSKYPSLVKVASWVERAKGIIEREAENLRARDLDTIPTAVVRREQAKPRPGSGRPNPQVKLVEERLDRWSFHEPQDRAKELNRPEGPRPREHESVGIAHEELNPVSERVLHARRKDPPLAKRALEEALPAIVKAVPPEPELEPGQSAAGFRTFEDYKGGRMPVRPLDRKSLTVGEDQESSTDLEQEEFEADQEIKKRMPIWHVRGVQYPSPFRAYFGAFVTVMAILCVIASAAMCVIAPIYLNGNRLALIIPFSGAVLFGLCYLLFAVGVHCRVCSCHLFYSRRCLKNKKAHRLLGGLPMLAQSMHMLLFRWFRCMYCGTAIRLKRAKE